MPRSAGLPSAYNGPSVFPVDVFFGRGDRHETVAPLADRPAPRDSFDPRRRRRPRPDPRAGGRRGLAVGRRRPLHRAGRDAARGDRLRTGQPGLREPLRRLLPGPLPDLHRLAALRPGGRRRARRPPAVAAGGALCPRRQPAGCRAGPAAAARRYRRLRRGRGRLPAGAGDRRRGVERSALQPGRAAALRRPDRRRRRSGA